MGYFDDIVPLDTAASYVATPPGVPRITVRPSFETGATRPPQDEGFEPPPGPPQPDDMPADLGRAPSPRATGLFDDIVAPATRVRTAGLPFGDGDEIVGQAAPPGKSVFFHDDDSIADNAARTRELAWHKAAIESALSNTVPLRLQHPRPVEIAARLMADYGMPLDEALDRVTMRLHAEEGTAEAGKISDVIGKEAFDEAQRVAADGRTAEFVGRAASPDLAPPAQGVGQSHAAPEKQARPDGEHASGDSAPQGGEAAGGKTIGSEDAVRAEPRAQSGDELISAAAKGEGSDQGLAFGRNDAIVERPGQYDEVVVPAPQPRKVSFGADDAIVENPPRQNGTPERLVPLWQPFPIDQNSLGAVASAIGRPELAAPVNPSDASFADPTPAAPSAPQDRRFAPSLGEYGITDEDPSAANLWKLPPGSTIKAMHDILVFFGDIYAGRKHLPQTFDPSIDDPAADEAIRQSLNAATVSTMGAGAKFRAPRGTYVTNVPAPEAAKLAAKVTAPDNALSPVPDASLRSAAENHRSAGVVVARTPREWDSRGAWNFEISKPKTKPSYLSRFRWSKCFDGESIEFAPRTARWRVQDIASAQAGPGRGGFWQADR
ncbi:MAG: hypothetical protein V7608_1488 [Hyphomicrobiales bacterium]|jgi:hypothetical protein